MTTTDQALPRVLFVTSCAFNNASGGGVTFSNLFRGWPQDRLATVHCDPLPTSDEVCNRYFVLGPDEIRRRWPFHRLVTAAAAAGGPSGAVASSLSWAREMKARIFGTGVPEAAQLSPALICFIEAFRPDVLYTIFGSNGLVDLVELIRARWGLPLAVHVMDDWRDTVYGEGWLSGWQRARLNRNMARLIHLSAVRLCISDAMAEAYGRDYGVPFLAFQNPVDVDRWPAVRHSLNEPPAVRRLLYSGAMLPFAQSEAIIEAAHAVSELAAAGATIRLDIHAPAAQAAFHRDRLPRSPAVRLALPFERWDDYAASIAAADALLLPVNFDRRTVRYIRYSMPTKLPEYLISGTPVLVYGPGGVAQVDDAVREGWGHVVSSPDRATLKEGIRRIMSDIPLRQALAARGKTVALTRHDSRQVRAAFQQAIATAAG